MLFDITKSQIDFKEVDTVDGFIFVGTNFRGLNRNDIFVRIKIRGYYIFLHKSYRKSLFRWY